MGLGGPGGGGGDCRCAVLITLPPLCADCLEIQGASTSWSLKGLAKPVKGKLYLLTSVIFGDNYEYWLHVQGWHMKLGLKECHRHI